MDEIANLVMGIDEELVHVKPLQRSHTVLLDCTTFYYTQTLDYTQAYCALLLSFLLSL
jgi:hypothetical protein